MSFKLDEKRFINYLDFLFLNISFMVIATVVMLEQIFDFYYNARSQFIKENTNKFT